LFKQKEYYIPNENTVNNILLAKKDFLVFEERCDTPTEKALNSFKIYIERVSIEYNSY